MLRRLVGRRELIGEVVDSLAEERLVTLTGPGGVGKTSVAVHAAADTATRCRDGVSFVDLVAIAEGHEVLAALAAALGFRPTSNDAALEELTDVLQSRQQLIVFDNCEHVVDAAAGLVESLRWCPELHFLATSRAPLALVDEVVIDVPPLSTAETAGLFVTRARAHGQRFEPTDDDHEAVAKIASIVDGLPLAVELTSPLVRTMTPRQIVEQLEHDRAGVPARRGLETRHASMDNAVAWSYQLLDDDAGALFERLSVFEAGTDLAGVGAVCADDAISADGCVRGRPVHEVLDTLISRSLIAVDRTSSGLRYRMLWPIRSFARRALERSGDCERVHAAHVRHTIAVLRSIGRVIESDDPMPGMVELEHAAGDVRAAYRACVTAGDRLQAAELVASFSTFAGSHPRRSPNARSGSATPWPPTPRPRSGSESCSPRRDVSTPTPGKAESSARWAVEFAEQLGDVDAMTLASTWLLDVVAETDPDAVDECGKTALEQSAHASSPIYEAFVLNSLVNPLLRANRIGDARSLLDPRVAIGTRRYGLLEPQIQYQAGRVAFVTGTLDRAKQHFLAAETAANRIGSMWGLAYALFGLARVARAIGDLEEALRLHTQALECAVLIAPGEAWADHLQVAIVATQLGRLELASRQIEALSGSDRPLVIAARTTVAAWVARANGYTDVAIGHWQRAAIAWAALPVTEQLIDVLTEWATCLTDRRCRRRAQHCSRQPPHGTQPVLTTLFRSLSAVPSCADCSTATAMDPCMTVQHSIRHRTPPRRQQRTALRPPLRTDVSDKGPTWRAPSRRQHRSRLVRTPYA